MVWNHIHLTGQQRRYLTRLFGNHLIYHTTHLLRAGPIVVPRLKDVAVAFRELGQLVGARADWVSGELLFAYLFQIVRG